VDFIFKPHFFAAI